MHAPPTELSIRTPMSPRAMRFAPTRRYTPDYDATPDTYLSLLDTHGLDGGVLVQPSFLGTDNSYLLEALGKAPHRLWGVAVIDPGTSRDELDRLVRAGVCGIRLNLVGRPVPPLHEAVWQRLGRALAARNLHLEVQARAEQWNELSPWLLRWPGQVVVDHLGLPLDTTLSSPGAKALVSLLTADHVWVKASAPYRSARAAASAMLHHVLDTAGPARTLWGSDWPWTQHEEGRTYADTLSWLMRQLSATEITQVLCANPLRLLTGGRAGDLAAPVGGSVSRRSSRKLRG
ncbi:putative 2-pyrone-4,6-dicarboxylic acid hydrolase [Streptomyces himastatinicus ATCC 53653]|uniref:Putative 2-pyrone-4,6-dicarboxylic acid hydrolase n=2 Tax=Streptomyces violaceusniger group TaxID=2839105 RepID=D9WMR9_9ACTN|nr:putative 2-pyrone-4,6-dicarboxylic acid hydrolase [Streptomyces himastatinicus ATCC 53653]